MELKHILMLLVVLGLMAAPLIIYNGKGEDEGYFGGSDDSASKILSEKYGVEEKQPFYWTPPSGEIESLLFALQAAIGAIIIGYFIGYYKGIAKGKGINV